MSNQYDTTMYPPTFSVEKKSCIKFKRMATRGLPLARPDPAKDEWSSLFYDVKVVSEASYEVAKTYRWLDDWWGSARNICYALSASGGAIEVLKKVGIAKFPHQLNGVLPYLVVSSALAFAVDMRCRFEDKAKRHEKVAHLYNPLARDVKFFMKNDPSWNRWLELSERRNDAEKETTSIPRWAYGYASHIVLYKLDSSLEYRSGDVSVKISAPSKWRYFWLWTSKDAFVQLRNFKDVWEKKVHV